MGQAMYTIKNLEQWYENRRVLNIESLNIRKGEILAVIGPSGAGKSTLLRLLNFLELPTKGKLTFEQNANGEIPLSQRRRVTTVFQTPVLLKRNVLSNLKFGLTLRGENPPQKTLTDWLDRLGLTALAKQSARKLSTGEAQRVALARALIIRPDVLLLDEPTANLDPYNVKLIESVVQEENKTHGTTVVLVTHNIFQAKRIADRIVFLWEGTLREVADTETFFQNPKTPEARGFIRGELVY